MLKQTIQLFLRALIIGLLLNVGLQQVAPAAPTPQIQQEPVSQSVGESGLQLADQIAP